MAKKTLEQIKKRLDSNVKGYLTYDKDSKAKVLGNFGSVVDSFEMVGNKVVAQTDTAKADSNNTQLRSPYWPGTYERLRPWDSIPMRFRDIVLACRQTYIRVGIVRNVIDLMTDFTCEDLKIVHPDRKVETFFRVWKNKVQLNEVVSEFARHLLLDANLAVKRYTAILTKPFEKQLFDKVSAADIKLKVENPKIEKREIPWKYRFLNIAALEWIGGDASNVLGEKKLGFRVATSLIKLIRNPANDPFATRMARELPPDVKENVNKSVNGVIPLDMTNIYVAHNKKDSWEDWAPPFLYAILSDIKFKEKLRHMEVSAADGFINTIRVWKLGDHKLEILPTEDAITKLVGILQNNTGGGTVDLVWDSMIDMKADYPPIDQILGKEKYEQVNADILIGLGIPEVLLGAGGGAKFSNSFIQLKTLIEKLKYIRTKIIDWLNGEMALICRSMDFPSLPKVSFGEMNLEDANITKKLIVGLLDRGIISADAVLQVYGEDFLIETERIKEQQGIYKANNIEIKSPFDQADPMGQPGQGRPPGSNDTSKRDQRNPKPRRTGNIDNSMMAMDVLDLVEDIVVPIYMQNIQVSNARKLTSEQKNDIDQLRMIILSSIKPDSKVSEETIMDISENSNNFDAKLYNQMNKCLSEYVEKNGKLPTLPQKKRILALSWGEFYN